MGTQFSVDPEDARSCVPKGEYVVIVEKMESKKAKPRPGDDKTKEKFPYIEVTMRVLDGQYQDWPIVDRLSLSPDAKFRIAGFVKACGLARGSGEQQFDTDQFVGAILCLKGDVEENAAFGDTFRPARYWMHPDKAKELGLEATSLPGQAAPAAGTSTASAAPAAAPATETSTPAPAASPSAETKRVPPPPPKKKVSV